MNTSATLVYRVVETETFLYTLEHGMLIDATQHCMKIACTKNVNQQVQYDSYHKNADARRICFSFSHLAAGANLRNKRKLSGPPPLSHVKQTKN